MTRDLTVLYLTRDCQTPDDIHSSTSISPWNFTQLLKSKRLTCSTLLYDVLGTRIALKVCTGIVAVAALQLSAHRDAPHFTGVGAVRQHAAF